VSACAVVRSGDGEATECGGAVGGDMYKAAENMQRRHAVNAKTPKGADVALRHNVNNADAAPQGGICSRATGLKV